MTDAQELIRIARDAIGDGGKEDWKIIPSDHAEWFEQSAPTLSQNLRRARPEGLAKMYEELDSDANTARTRFQTLSGRAAVAVFVAGSIGALLVVVVGLQPLFKELALDSATQYLVYVLGGTGVLASSFAALWLQQSRSDDAGERWTGDRANAEAKRLAYFKDVMEGASEEPLDKLLAFEYTRRFLLDNQLDYFRGRGLQHEEAAQAAADRSAYATFAASLFTAAGGALAAVKPHYGAVAGLAAVATGLGSLFSSRSELNLDAQSADRYRAAADALWERRLDLDVYRERIANGDTEALMEFYQPVFMALKADHQAFLDDAQEKDLAIGEMKKRLDSADKKLKKGR